MMIIRDAKITRDTLGCGAGHGWLLASKDLIFARYDAAAAFHVLLIKSSFP
jgi:hypothetical protein